MRPGAPSDRTTIQDWVKAEPDTGIKAMVMGTAEKAASRDPRCLVLHDLTLDVPVGCYLLGSRFLNVMFLKAGARGCKLGLRGAVVCVEHFFNVTGEADLGVDQVYPDGRRVLEPLGFGPPQREFDKLTLTRKEWLGKRVALVTLFP